MDAPRAPKRTESPEKRSEPDRLSKRESRIAAYVCSEMSQRDAAALEAEMEADPGLRREVEQWRAALEIGRAWTMAEAPDVTGLDIIDIPSIVRRERMSTKTAARPVPVRRLAGRFVAVAAIILAVVCVGRLAEHGPGGLPSPHTGDTTMGNSPQQRPPAPPPEHFDSPESSPQGGYTYPRSDGLDEGERRGVVERGAGIYGEPLPTTGLKKADHAHALKTGNDGEEYFYESTGELTGAGAAQLGEIGPTVFGREEFVGNQGIADGIEPAEKKARDENKRIGIETTTADDGGFEPSQPSGEPVAAEPSVSRNAKAILQKMKAADARYRSGFTATGLDVIYSGPRDMPPQKMRWTITMAGERMAYEQQVVEVLKWEDVLGPDEELPPKDERGGLFFLVSRRTVFFGPEFTGMHTCVGGIPPAGPIAPTPEGERGEIGFCDVTVTAPDAPTYINYTTCGPMHMVGRGFSKYVDRITDIHHREDGMTSLTVEGTKARGKPPAERSIEFEIVVDPEADYMVRRFKGTDWSDRFLVGLKRNGDVCAPETIEMPHERRCHRIVSILPKPDPELLRRAEARMRGPFHAPTKFKDWRNRKRKTTRKFQAGESWDGKRPTDKTEGEDATTKEGNR